MYYRYSQMRPLQSKNLILREAKIEDAKDLFECYKSDLALKYLPLKKHNNINITKKFIKRFFINNYENGRIGHYVVVLKEDNKVIGNAGFNNIYPKDKIAEMGICINPKYWGNDYSTELARLFVTYGFNMLNLDKIIVEIYKDNVKSKNSIKKIGFKCSETVKKQFNSSKISKNKYVLCDRYELLKNK